MSGLLHGQPSGQPHGASHGHFVWTVSAKTRHHTTPHRTTPDRNFSPCSPLHHVVALRNARDRNGMNAATRRRFA